MRINQLLGFISIVSLFGCDKGNGLFGHSNSKREALNNGSIVTEYLPDKTAFKLLDGTIMKTDTAWTEESFTYKNGKRLIDNAYGFTFAVPVKNDNTNNFTFTFRLLDTTNRMFTNPGPEQDGFCHLRPIKLYDEMKIVLEQKDTDTAKGWTNPIITDTITFKKIQRPK